MHLACFGGALGLVDGEALGDALGHVETQLDTTMKNAGPADRSCGSKCSIEMKLAFGKGDFVQGK